MHRRFWILLPLLVLVGLIAVRAADPSAVRQLRNAAFDQFQRLKPRVQPIEKSYVRIVDIDDESLRRIGQWPWPRDRLATLIRNLHARGAVVVTLDMIFSEADRLSPRQLAERPDMTAFRDKLKALPDTDAALAKAIAGGPVVTAFVLNNGKVGTPPAKTGFAWGGYDPAAFIFQFSGAVINLPAIDKSAAGAGAINYIGGQDQIVRRIPTVLRIGSTLYPSLFAETLRVASGARGFKIRTSGASGESDAGSRTGITAIQIGQAPVPTDANGQLLLYYAKIEPRRFIPAWQVLNGSVDASAIKNRIVLIGTSAAGLKDLRTTPLGVAVPGVAIHAQAIDQVLAGLHLRRPDFADGMELALIAVMGAILILTLSRLGAIGGGIAFGTVIVLLAGGAWYAFAREGLLLDPTWAIISMTVVFLATTLLTYIRAERQRNRVRNAFGHYLAPAMVERLARNPASLTLGGEMRDLTILFSDVRGFTGISERFDAAGLTAFMNDYLTPMTDAVLARGGTIDKYMGDAIMAFWNAPIDTPNHANEACLTALDMMKRLDELNRTVRIPLKENEQKPPPLRIGIGINTGPCSVGNMGSEQRFDYSALGDDVNLASRLEGLTKQYGVAVIVGEATRQAAAEFAFVELDLIRVKGKSAPARIYALLGDPITARTPEFLRLAEAHQSFLTLYRSCAWSDALTQIEICQSGGHNPNSAALASYYSMMKARVRHYQNVLIEPRKGDGQDAGAPFGWDGVHIAEEK